MKKLNLIDLIKVDEYSITSKYLQIVNCVIRGIQNGHFNVDDPMPSINELSIELDIARDTVERGYKHLKNLGIIHAVPRRGYFIKDNEFKQALKIFLLFNKLSAHKKTLYDSFVSSLGEHAIIDFYIYNNDFNFFRKLINDKMDHYSKFVIIPHFIENSEKAFEVINTIPKEKLILMDKLVPGVTGTFGAVYEDFEQDIYHALEQLLRKLSKYHTLKIIFPENTYHAKDILTGFSNFCTQYAFEYDIIHSIAHENFKKGTVYINLMEDDLVALIEKIIANKLKPGYDIGVISYNETPIKKIILDGVTTISTDFKLMGEKTAELVLKNSTEHIAIPFRVTLRNSL